MSILAIILLITVVVLLVYFVPRLDAPFRNIAIGVIVVVLILVLLSLLGVIPGGVNLLK